MVRSEHFRFQIVTDLIYQIYLYKRFATNEIPYYTLFSELVFMAWSMIYSMLSYVPCHPLFRIFPDKIAVFTCKLTVFGDYKCYVLGHAIFPAMVVIFYHCCAHS